MSSRDHRPAAAPSPPPRDGLRRWPDSPGVVKALAVSLVIHGLLVFGPHRIMPRLEDDRRLRAVLAETRNVAPGPPPAGMRLETPRPPPPKIPSPSSRPARVPAAPAPALPLPAPVPVPAATGDPAPRAEAPVGAAIPPAVAPPPVPEADAATSDGLRHYRLALAREARQLKRYPPLARERGWSGTVEVHLTHPAGLPAPLVSLGRSSGHGVLDRQALETIGQAARRVDLPASLRGRELRLAIPVEFALED